MFLVMMAIGGLGFLIKYVLIPGYKRIELYNNDVELYFLGLTRHDWGKVHLWLGFIFLFLLLLHIIFHWKMIVCIFRKMISRDNLRLTSILAIGIAGLFLLLSPLLIKPETGPSVVRYRNRNVPVRFQNDRYDSNFHDYRRNPHDQNSSQYGRGRSYTPRRWEQRREERHISPGFNQRRGSGSGEYSYGIIRVNNTMTLDEVAKTHTVSAKELARELNIPETLIHENISTLRKEYTFLLTDVRKAVMKLQDD